MAKPSSLRPLLGTKSEHHVGALTPGEVEDRLDWLPSARAVWLAPRLPARARASGLRSTTMMVVAVRAARHWMPMCPSPPAPITAQVVPG